MNDWSFDAEDAEAAAEIMRRFPDRMFDAHAHAYAKSMLTVAPESLFAVGPDEVDASVWREHAARQIGPRRLCGGLLFPVPMLPVGAVPRANRHLFDGIAGDETLKGLALVAPQLTPEDYETLLGNPQFAGFKPYHAFSEQKPTFQAPLSAFLPEWAWAMADERGLVITLHLVRDRALADPDNQREIREWCARYPNARLVLAHAARGFHAPNTVDGIVALRGLENVWFDTSGICESAPIEAILREFGPRRLLWGSDFPVSEIRGRCVTLGNGFAWLQHDTMRWDKLSPPATPFPVGLESLRALRKAAEAVNLNAEDWQDVCADNALRLLGMKADSSAATQALYRQAKQRIPGGTQLLSKRPEMQAPDQWPAYFREARGCETWDLDGRHYYDFSTNGIGSCLLGFRDPDVTRAVQRRIGLGAMSTLNPPEEVELADLLCEIHSWAEQARFARCGGEACAMAVRIARATTDRSVVAICGYSGWQDWYLAANLGESDALRGHLLPGLSPLGVPGELRGTAVTFQYNDRAGFEALLDEYGERLAAVVMEPCRSNDPAPGFLEAVRDGAHRVGALLVFDEITIGWRLCVGGAHLRFGVAPDLAVFAKALGNGHPMAGVIGTRTAMSGAQESFISSTYWTESVGPTAAVATVRKMQAVDVPAHIAHIGERVRSVWETCAQTHDLPLSTGGYPCLIHFSFDHEQVQALRTLFTQTMLNRGFLAGAAVYPTLAHSDGIVDRYTEAVDAAFANLAAVLDSGDAVEAHLNGPVAHTGFKRLTS